MKTTMQFMILSLLAVFTFTSCRKDKTEPLPEVQNASDFIQKNGPQRQVVRLNTNDFPVTVKLRKGTEITIPAGALKLKGADVSGTVTLEAYEMLERSDIILGGANTNHISGAPLHSDGFIFLDFKVGGVSVDQSLTKPVNIAIPAKRNGGTLLWEGAIDDNGNFAWAPPRDNNPRETKGMVGDAFRFNFGQLGWINCDVFWGESNPKTTMRVKLLNNPGTFANFRGFDGETFVFFCGKGSNVAAHVYTLDGTDGVKSYDNSMPVGMEGRLLAFSIKEGRFYLAKKDITITENISETLSLVETTESAIQSEIDALNDY